MDIQAVFADGYFAKLVVWVFFTSVELHVCFYARISLAAVACGFLTDTLIKVKKFARFGQVKSLIGAVSALISFKPYNIAVEYRPRQSPQVSSRQTCSFS